MEKILAWLGFGDQLIATMGPTLAIILAIAGGTAAAQFFKYPLSRLIVDDGLFSWCVRAIALLSTFALCLLLSDKVSFGLAVVFAFLQLGLYHLSLQIIRRKWPWLEVHAAVGAIEKPLAAVEAARKRDRGEDSGA